MRSLPGSLLFYPDSHSTKLASPCAFIERLDYPRLYKDLLCPREQKADGTQSRGAALTLREAAGLQKQGTHRTSKATLRNCLVSVAYPVAHWPPGCTNLLLRQGPSEAIRMVLILGIPRSMVGSFIHSSSSILLRFPRMVSCSSICSWLML